MKRDLARLIERNLLAGNPDALRPRRPSRFEPAAIDDQPPGAVESAHTIALASSIHSADYDADGLSGPPRTDTPILESPPRPSSRALTLEEGEEAAETRPLNTVVATVVQSREPAPPFGEEAASWRGTRAADRRMLSAPIARPRASSGDDVQHELPAPVIEVTIGRVDVRAILPSPAPAPPRPVRSTTTPLEEYLRDRSRGRR